MKEFHVLDRVIEFSTPKMNYLMLKMQYEQLALEAADQLQKGYERLGCLKKVAENLGDTAEELYRKVVKQAVNQLQMQEIYTVDEEGLERKFGGLFYRNFQVKFEKLVCDPYEEMVGEKEDAYEFRRKRKANRARWQAYGWGIGGTIKAGMKAGAMNMASGMGHSLVNAVGNAGSEVSTGAKMQALYKDKEVRLELAYSLYAAVMEILPEVVTIIERNTDIAFEYASDAELSEAKALSSNLLKGNVPAEKLKELIVKSLTLNPINQELYQYAVESFGDEQKEIEQMAGTFGCELKEFKAQCIDKVYGDLNKKTYENEESLLEEKEKIIRKCRYYGLDSLPYEEILNRKWLEIDKALRTVEGIEYETREIARNVEKDINTFHEKCASVDWDGKNLLDNEVRNACEEDVEQAPYLTEEFKSQIRERLDCFLKPYLYRQNIISRLSESETFLENFAEMVSGEEFYKASRNKFRFCEFVSDAKNKAPNLDEENGKALLYEDLSLLGGWKKGIILTTRKFIRYDKNQMVKIDLNDITGVEEVNGEIVIHQNNGSVSFGKLTGVPAKNLRDYAAFFYAAAVGISKTDIAAVEERMADYKAPEGEKEPEHPIELAGELENAKEKLKKAVGLFGKFIKQ